MEARISIVSILIGVAIGYFLHEWALPITLLICFMALIVAFSAFIVTAWAMKKAEPALKLAENFAVDRKE